MITKYKILALIPARGGSKGIKDKNIVDLCGRPLISYTIGAALKSKYIDSVVVSTDSPKISSVSLNYGAMVPFLRPKKLASDTAKTIEVMEHALKKLMYLGKKYDIVVLLQATSPLRSYKDIDCALELFVERKGQSLLSINEVSKHPLLIRALKKGNKLSRILDKRSDVRRQDMNKYYFVNGAIYINKVDQICSSTSLNDNEIGYVLPEIRSVDIDDETDLVIAKALMKMKK